MLLKADRLGSPNEIRTCIAKLGPDHVEALLLQLEWGFSFEEIAALLGVSAAVARARASWQMADMRVALNSLQGSRMMDRSQEPPEALPRTIAHDLRPVRPSPQPIYLALRMVPFAFLVLFSDSAGDRSPSRRGEIKTAL